MNIFDTLNDFRLLAKPVGAKVLYKVSWGIEYDSGPGLIKSGIQVTPEIYKNYKFFTEKAKAEELKRQIDEAFKILGLIAQGRCTIKEEYYEE